MDRRVTVKFWQISPALVEGVQFAESLAIALGQNDPPDFEMDGNKYRFDAKSAPDAKLMFGDVIRLQSEAFPSLVTKGQKPTKLSLKKDQNLGHHTGFIYDPEHHLLGFEIKPAAAGLVKLLSMVAAMAKHPICIPLPVLTENALKDLAGTKNGAIKFKIADPASLHALDPELETARDNLAYLKDMVDGAYVTVSIGVGPRTEGLSPEGVSKIVGWLLGERDAERGKVRSIKVTTPHEDEALLDFIKAQFKNTDTLQLTGDPDSDWIIREEFLESSLAKAKNYVRKGDG